jgi:hypothetical protein
LPCQARPPLAALHLYSSPFINQCSGLPAPLLTAMVAAAVAAGQRGCMMLPELTVSTLGFSAIFHTHASLFRRLKRSNSTYPAAMVWGQGPMQSTIHIEKLYLR